MSKESLIREFVSSKSNNPKYIFGRNVYSKKVCKYVNVSGFIDERTSENIFENRKILHSLSELPSNAIVLNCVVEGAAWIIEKKLSEWGGAHIDFFSFVKFSGFPLSIEYWDGFANSYRINKEKYDNIRNLLQDDLSQQTFDRLIKFKLNYDITQMSFFEMNLDKQYFEPFLNLRTSGEFFCDVGGYDGSTSLNFIKHCPKYEKIPKGFRRLF